MATTQDGAGFSLVETLVAVLVFLVGVVGAMPLIASAVRTARDARDTGMATWLAWQKAEELRGGRVPVSPAGTLDANTAGYVDHLDSFGRTVEPPGLYTRRWAVAPAGAGVLRIAVGVHHAAAPGTPVVLASIRSRGLP